MKASTSLIITASVLLLKACWNCRPRSRSIHLDRTGQSVWLHQAAHYNNPITIISMWARHKEMARLFRLHQPLCADLFVPLASVLRFKEAGTIKSHALEEVPSFKTLSEVPNTDEMHFFLYFRPKHEFLL